MVWGKFMKWIEGWHKDLHISEHTEAIQCFEIHTVQCSVMFILIFTLLTGLDLGPKHMLDMTGQVKVVYILFFRKQSVKIIPLWHWIICEWLSKWIFGFQSDDTATPHKIIMQKLHVVTYNVMSLTMCKRLCLLDTSSHLIIF